MKSLKTRRCDSLPTAAATYYQLDSNYSATTEVPNVVSVGFDVLSLDVVVSAAPGTGKSWTITIRKNGATSGVSVTVADTNTTALYTGGAVSFAPGDLVSIEVTQSGTPASGKFAHVNFVTETSGNTQQLFGQRVLTSASATRYGTFNHEVTNATTNILLSVMPCDGTISDLYANLSASPGTGLKKYTFTVIKNGTPQALTCDVTAGLTQNHDTTHSFAVAAGDLISYSVAPSSTPTDTLLSSIGVKFTPTNTGEFALFASTSTYVSDATTYYGNLVGYKFPTTTEANTQNGVNAMTIKTMYVSASVAPGTGLTRTVTLRKNGADTELSAVLSNAGVLAYDTAELSITAGDLLNYAVVPGGGSPAEARISFSVCCVMPADNAPTFIPQVYII